MKKALKILLGVLLALSVSVGLISCKEDAKFKINFLVDGEAYYTVETNGGEDIAFPDAPVKTGYIFEGWFWDDVTFEIPFTSESLADKTLRDDLNVYSKWTCTHSLSDWIVDTPATCIKSGSEYIECTQCKEVMETRKIKPLNHDRQEHEAKAPTCTEDGWEAYETCSRCDYTTFKSIPKTHKYTSIVTSPGCLVGGYTTYTCSECGDSYIDDRTDPTGHTMGNWYQIKPVTKESDVGEMRSDCLNCDIYETRATKILMEGNFGEAETSGAEASSSAVFKLFEDGTLKISGTGDTFACGKDGSAQPYLDYRAIIKKVIICDGITSVSTGSLAFLSNLEAVELPDTLEKISSHSFKDSFKKGVTSITVPASVTSIGTYVFGNNAYKNATFTDIIFENPDIRIYRNSVNTNWIDSNYEKVINSGRCNSELRIYSYGSDNGVKKFADAIGATYIDLNSVVSGTVGNLKYMYFGGRLEFNAVDPTTEAILPATMPWLALISNKDVVELVIGEGVKDIPADYFRGYTSLESVTLSGSIESIGNRAFATVEACNENLDVTFPAKLKTLGVSIFENRTNVTVDAFYSNVIKNYTESGVTLKLRRSLRLLLIGNSLSLDGADCSSGGTPSQLYDIIKAMLGEDSYVEIGTLYSGAKSATWHATMAETGRAKYSFMVISDDTDGLWKVISSSATTRDGLDYSDWDYVTIQPYASETTKGIGSMTGDNAGDCEEKDEKFLALSDSLPFLLDYIEMHNPGAEVYYYCTWPSVMDYSELNIGAADLEKRIKWAKESMAYFGDRTKKEFSGWIPAGTSIQNARTTYLGLLNYTDSYEKDTQKGLQRDNVHLSLHLGRYIAGLTIAEFVVPKEMRVESYTLPDIAESDIIGKLPKEYTTLAQMAVEATIESGKLTGTEQYNVTVLEGYENDPTVKFAAAVAEMSFMKIQATSISELEDKLIDILKASAPEDMEISVKINGTALQRSFSAVITLSFGYMSKNVAIIGTVEQ